MRPPATQPFSEEGVNRNAAVDVPIVQDLVRCFLSRGRAVL